MKAIIIVFICIFILTQVCLRYVTVIAKTNELTKPLPDLGHEYLPEFLRNYHEYTDIFPLAPLILFIFLDKFKHAVQFIFLISIIYLLRATCFSLTILPSPYNQCKCEWEHQPETPLRKFLNILYQEGCNDCIFSGHTSMMVMSTLFILYYTEIDIKYKISLIVYNIIGMIMIVGTRLHYSVDVFIAFIINLLLFLLFNKYPLDTQQLFGL